MKRIAALLSLTLLVGAERSRDRADVILSVRNNLPRQLAQNPPPCWDITILAAGCQDSQVQPNYHVTFCDWKSMEPTAQAQIEYSDLMMGQEFLRGTWPAAVNGSCVWSRIHYSESDFNLQQGVGHTDPVLVNFSYAKHHGGMPTSIPFKQWVRKHLEEVRKRGPQRT